MKKIGFFFCLLFLQIIYAQKQDVSVVFHSPATHFTESLPFGNGRLGGMLFGKTDTEIIKLNEISLWSGGQQDADDENAHTYLREIQELLLRGDNLKAQALLQEHFVSKGKGTCFGNGANCHYGAYQTLGELRIKWGKSDNITDYRRILDVEKAVATTEYLRDGNQIVETVFADFNNDILWVNIKTNTPENLVISLFRKENVAVSITDNKIIMQGILPNEDKEGMQFVTIVEIISNGKLQTAATTLQINSATEITIKISGVTNYNYADGTLSDENLFKKAQQYLDNCKNIPFENALAQSETTYQNYFNRNRFEMPATANTQQFTTEERLQHYYKGENDAQLPVLYYNFGRYLLISSSRSGLLPANLQGLWAEEYQTPWNGDYHLNINLQMNYWLAEPTNLSDLTEPLHRFTKNLMPNGRKTAKAYYNANGWVAHVVSNPWFFTSPGEGAGWGSTLTGGAWLCQHIWQHYAFTKDIDFLREYYPVLKEATAFFQDLLIKEPETGFWVTAPSNSPENAYIMPGLADGKAQVGFTCMAPTMDMQIIRELFSNTLKASEILGKDIDKRSDW